MTDQITVDPLVGTTVAHYDILAKLGGGGMGVVYSARDARLGRRIALKFLPPSWSHDESAKQRFIREAQAASATDHRNICTIHDIDIAPDGRLFIVMAQYDGPTLKQRLESGPLMTDEAIEIAAQVAEGLARAHAQGVVHRDIKPGNLILTDDGVRILDFGLARFVGSLHLTLDGSTLGTVAYMSPEQSRGDDADARSDVWSVGVVLYEMLTGELPFKGAYAEAITHAIRSEPTPGLGERSGENLQVLERLIRRALEKDPAQRYQGARDLARDLRLLQGRTLPIDLRTGTIPVSELAGRRLRGQRWWTRKGTLAAAAATAAATAGIATWIFLPVDRVPVAVAPVVNQTGYAELDPYRLALTQELVAELSDSPVVRVLPYPRLLEIVRRFRTADTDISSREALQAISTTGGASVVIVPTLLYENGAWRARVEFRNANSATNSATFDTPATSSLLVKETALRLMPALTSGILDHFAAVGPKRRLIAAAIARRFGNAPATPATRTRTLDGALAFERALDAYAQLEYGAAATSLSEATKQDPRNPLVWAWLSRVTLLTRRDDQARDAAEQALRFVSSTASARDRAFIEAVVAESRRDFDTATTRYNDLVAASPGESGPLMELGAYQDRRVMTAAAVTTYRQALGIDRRLPRAHLELCRLYNRLNESTDAKTEAQLAETQYDEFGDAGGRAQALLCAADALRVGSPKERQQARLVSEQAAMLFRDLGAAYNLPRAYYYAAMIAGMQGQTRDAIAYGEQSLAAAREGGNLALQPRILNNLGVTNEAIGDRARALDYYQQSYRLSEMLGDERDAASVRVNAGALAIEYGGDLGQGLREIQGALAVFQKIGDKNFEVFCLQLMGAYNRYTGRHAEAERLLNRALAIARERDLKDDIAALTIDLARSRADLGEYAAARDLFQQALGDGSGPKSVEARARLASVLARLGDVKGAVAALQAQAAAPQNDPALFRLVNEAAGESAFETGAFADARRLLQAAASLTDTFPPDAAALEARIRLGLLDALEGRAGNGRSLLRAALEQAHRMGRYALEARSRIYLARIDVQGGRFADAFEWLRPMPPDGEQALGPELQAQMHFWRARASIGRGDGITARSEGALARKLLDALRSTVPSALQPQFDARPDIRPLHSM